MPMTLTNIPEVLSIFYNIITLNKWTRLQGHPVQQSSSTTVCTHQRPVESGGGVLHGEGRVGVLLRRGVASAVHAYSTVQINISGRS